MTQYEIKPFELTPDFQNCWLAAGRHLNLRVRDTGSRWLRAELPPFREHLSFALGNQLFFVQIFDVDDPDNGWLQESRLRAAVADANGVACLMPMRRSGADWVPVEQGWGLIDLGGRLLDPIDSVTDEPIEMTPWEIHDFGVQAVRHYLQDKGWSIASWQTDLQVDPSIFAEKDGFFCGFVVRTANDGNGPGRRPASASQLARMMHQRGWGAKFVGLAIADYEAAMHTDPNVQHFTGRVFRRSGIMMSGIEVEELDS